jgi:FkbM family methyltransferase
METALYGLDDALQESRNAARLSDHIDEFRFRPIIIYGAGYSGKYACDILMKNGISPKCFFDEKAATIGSYCGIPIRNIADDVVTREEKENSVVILCVLAKTEVELRITDAVRANGYTNVFPYQQKAFSNDFIRRRLCETGEPAVFEYRDEILACAGLFHDMKSRVAYSQAMKAFCSRKFNDMPFIETDQQYVPPDINFSKGYSRFVDCGAFYGDTVIKLFEKNLAPEALFAFEPDLQNFRALSEKVDKLGLKNSCLFPCGVSSKTETMRFSSDATYSGAASALDPAGDILIQCVALDDVLKGVTPSFIKMDIEGAEMNALFGAKKTISTYKPDLAICVYHYIDHYFEIPHLINSWQLGYRFYFRTYDRNGNESVVYATA